MQHNQASMKLVLIFILMYSSYTNRNIIFTIKYLEKFILIFFKLFLLGCLILAFQFSSDMCFSDADDG